MNSEWYMEMNLSSLNFHGTNTPLTSSWRHPLSIEYLGICGFKEIQKIYYGVWVLMTSYFIILYKCFCEISFISILLRGYMGVRIWNSNSMCVYDEIGREERRKKKNQIYCAHNRRHFHFRFHYYYHHQRNVIAVIILLLVLLLLLLLFRCCWLYHHRGRSHRHM